MKTEEAAKLAGCKNKLALLLGISRQAVNSWGEDVPDGRLWQLKCIRPDWFEKPKVKACHKSTKKALPKASKTLSETDSKAST